MQRAVDRFIARLPLRWLLSAATLSVLAPLLLASLLLGHFQHQARQREVAVSAEDLARRFALKQMDTVSHARGILAAVAAVPGLSGAAPEGLRRQFRRIIDANPEYAYLTLAGPDGRLRGSSATDDATIDFSGREVFQAVREQGRFVQGLPVVSRTTGEYVLPFGAPLLTESGALAGVLFLGLRFSEYERFISSLNLPPGGRCLLFDDQGTRLLRYPQGEDVSVGGRLRSWDVLRDNKSLAGTFRFPDDEGRELVHSFVKVETGGAGGHYIGVLAGLPDPGWARHVWPVFGQGMVLILALTAAALLLNGYLSWRGVALGVETLTRGAAGIGRGEAGALAPLVGCREVMGLGAAFREMALALARDREARDRAEETLSRESARLRAVLETSLDGIHVMDAEGRLILCNASFARMLGRSSEEAARLRMAEWAAGFAPEALPGVIRSLLRMPGVFETRYRRKDGTLIEVEVGARAVELDGQERLMASARDITARKEAERALSELESRYRGLVENAPVGIFRSSPEGRYLSVNTRLAEMYGYDSAQALLDEVSDIASQVYLDRQEREDILRAARAGDRGGMEGRRRRRDGSVLWVSLSVRAVRDASGRVLHYEGFMTDITERRKAEDALRESEERYRGYFLSNEAMKLIIDPRTGAILDANPAAVAFYGYPLERLTQLFVYDLNILPRDEVLAELAMLSLHGSMRYCFRHRLAGGEVRDVEVFASLVALRGERVVISSIHDVTELRRLEELRADVERIVRHDLKSPLGGLINIPQIMLEDTNLTPEQRQMLKLVEASGRKMLAQINSSLELHRIEAGLYEKRAEACDPARLLTVNAGILETTMGLPPGTVAVEDLRPQGGARETTLTTDETLLDVILMNILRNALEATPPGGRVRVELTAQDGWCVIATANELAVPPEVRPRFFEKYATAGKSGGTGLGTYSADVMRRALGGSLSMETSEESGTRVVLRLPGQR